MSMGEVPEIRLSGFSSIGGPKPEKEPVFSLRPVIPPSGGEPVKATAEIQEARAKVLDITSTALKAWDAHLLRSLKNSKRGR